MTVKEATMKHVTKVYAQCKLNKAKACRILGITPATMYKWIREWKVCFEFDVEEQAQLLIKNKKVALLAAKSESKFEDDDEIFEVKGVFPTNEERLAHLDNPMYKRVAK